MNQPRMIYDSFLVNDCVLSHRIPSASADNDFSSLNSVNNFNIDDTCHRSDDIDSWDLLHRPFSFSDSVDDWFNNGDYSFKSFTGVRYNDSLNDILPVDTHLSAKPASPNGRYAENLNKDLAMKTNIVTLNTTNKPKLASGNKVAAQPKIFTYIEDVIENGLKVQTARAGRPKQEFDTSPAKVGLFYNDYVQSLQVLIEKNYSKKRSDTFRNTIFSYLKKLPIKLREMSCSVSEPKSHKLEIFLDAFLAPFVTCFLPYFDLSSVNAPKTDLFLYFICICYPEDKCIKILDKILAEDSMDKEKIERIKHTLVMRKGKSKKDITSYIMENPCFRLFTNQLMSKLDTSRFDEQASLMVNDFLINPEK